MSRTSLKLKLNEITFNTYDSKNDAIVNDTGSDKKCLFVKKDTNTFYVATNNRSDYPQTSPLILKGTSTRYIHQNTIIKKTVYYNPDEVDPDNKPYSSNPKLYQESPFIYTHYYYERIATERKQTWYGWWCTNGVGFNGVLPVSVYDSTPFWTTDANTINAHASNWYVWHVQVGCPIYQWYLVSEPRGTGIYDYRDELRSEPRVSTSTQVEVVY